MSKINRFAENATMHGLYRIVTAPSLRIRLLWLLLISGFSGYLLYQVTEIFKSFKEYSVVTRVEKSAGYPLVFPAVTICPSNAMKFFEGRESLNDEEINDLTMQADQGEDLIREYSFGSIDEHSYPTYFKKRLIPLVGLCYTFNPDGSLIQSQAGARHGLKIRLFVNSSETPPKEKQGDGILLAIHPYDYFPFPLLYGMKFPPGFYSSVAIRKVETIRIPGPYLSRCTDGKTEKRIFPGNYSRRNCLVSCAEIEGIKRCGGTDILTEVYLSKELKAMLSKNFNRSLYNACMEKVEDWLRKKRHIQCKCPVGCNEPNYEKTISYSKWPAKVDIPLLMKKLKTTLNSTDPSLIDEKYIYDNFMQIEIYFEDLSYERIIEMPQWTVTTLISAIGGQMGIWIGGSVFSLIEILVLLACIPFNFFWKNKQKEKLGQAESTSM